MEGWTNNDRDRHMVTSASGLTVVAPLLMLDKGRVSLQRLGNAPRFAVRHMHDGKVKYAQYPIPMFTLDGEAFPSVEPLAKVVQRCLWAARKRWIFLNTDAEEKCANEHLT